MKVSELLENEREPQVHKIPHTPHQSDAYDETQTNDKIKDGDVLHLGGDKTGVMVQAWPVEVTGDHSKESGYHTLAHGKTWDTLDDGKYKKSSEMAHEVAKKHAKVKEAKGDNEKQAHSEMEASVYRVLDSGNREELLKKTEDALIHLVQKAQDAHPSIGFSPVYRIRPWVQKWKAARSKAKK